MSTLRIQQWPADIDAFGNTEIISQHKTAFLCSRRYPAKAVLRIYDWAKVMRERGACVISGFHSRLEQDVLESLLKGTQPIILAAARGLPKRYSPDVKRALDNGRLLVVSPFPDSVTRITADTAHKRNQCMLAIADRIVIGYMSKDGLLAEALSAVDPQKEIIRLTDPTIDPSCPA